MTTPVCYLVRSDRGARLLGLRVVSLDDEASWQSPNSGPEGAPADARAAAEWLAERLSSNGRAISRLVVDTDGGVCSWVSATDTSPDVLRALVEQPFDQEDAEGTSRFPELPGETALETLGGPVASRKGDDAEHASRVSVLALPVVPARLLIDELDRLGIRVGEVEALWHAIGAAWDPAARASLGGANAERVISESVPVTGVILLDPVGRLVWAWSRGGEILAGGTQRIQTVRFGEGEPDRIERGRTRQPVVTASDVARVASDWFAWSMQLGVTPTRIVVVGDPAEAEGGLDAPGIGSALGRARPDAPVDIVREEDPIGRTMAYLAGREPRGRAGISELTDRPGRVHRAMYRWAAVALLLAAGAVGAVAWRFLGIAGEVDGKVRAINKSYVDVATDAGLSVATALLDADRRKAELEANAPDIASIVGTPKPVLPELEALSFVLASDDMTLQEIVFTELTVSIKVQVQSTEAFEALSQSIRSISGSVLDWRQTFSQVRDTIVCTFTGQWPTSEGQN